MPLFSNAISKSGKADRQRELTQCSG